MKQFFEGLRRWGTLTEEQLLVESILKDAKKKYPNVDPNWVDRLSERDPSGKNKYLMWATKQFAKMTEPYREKAQAQSDARGGHLHPDDEVVVAQASYEAYRAIADAVGKFHANSQRLKSKDINAYKTADDITAAIRDLGMSDRQKRQKRRERAQEGSTKIGEDDNFLVMRPLTPAASCYYGQGTGTPKYGPWCIAKTKGQNYFQSYTDDGKAFYIVNMKNLDEDTDGKKIALVYERDWDYDAPEEIWNRPNDSVEEDSFLRYVTKNIIAAWFSDYEKVYMEWETFHSDPEKENLTDNLKKLASNLGLDIEPPDDVDLELTEIFQEEVFDIFKLSAEHNRENPAGPDPQAYEDLLNAQDFSNVHVTLEDYGEGMWWDGGVYWKLPELEYAVDELGDEQGFGHWKDDILEIFISVADNNYIYPDESEAISSEEAIRFVFHPDHGQSTSLEGFESFLESMQTVEDAYDTILKEALQVMVEAGITTSEEYDKRAEQIRKKYLNKFENFGAIFEKGKIKFYQKEEYVVQMPLFRTLGGPELRRVEPRSAAQWLAPSPERDQYFKNTVGYLNTLSVKDRALKYAFDKTWPLAYDRSKEMQKQLSLTEIHLYGDYPNLHQLEFTEYLVDLENGGELGAAVIFSRVPTDDERGLAYADWLDENLDTFYDAVAEFILKTAHETRVHQGRANPGKFEAGRKLGFGAQDSEEQVSENASYSKLCEGWKRWAGK